MRLGFLIDQRRCIGCHACTVACKQEQEVPLGVYRTWVKYVEKGEYPVSGSHAWHQKVTVERAHPDDRYGDVSVDTEKSHQIYREWLKLTRPGPGPGNLRRPSWLLRPVKPALRAYLKRPAAGVAAAD